MLRPPTWQETAHGGRAECLYRLTRNVSAPHELVLRRASYELVRTTDLPALLDFLSGDMQLYVAEHARGCIFVHSGVVGWCGKAILIPGETFSGKSTLTAALVRHGAEYYSDEYAVLDATGRVHPYPRRLHLRNEDPRGASYTAAALGGVEGSLPLPVGLVALASYKLGAVWQPCSVSAGQAMLELLANTIPARRKPKAALQALRQVVLHASVLKGPRGDADETARLLLSQAA